MGKLTRQIHESLIDAGLMQPAAPVSLTELGSVSSVGSNGIILEFARALDGQPIAKMLVLAAVLAAN